MRRTKANILAGTDYVSARKVANNTYEWVDVPFYDGIEVRN